MKACVMIFVFLLTSCLSEGDNFQSKQLKSTKGETIYVNTVNWGVTNDYQMSCISNNPNKLKDIADSSYTVRGLEPFLYSFKNDTLNLFFKDSVNYKLSDKTKTIKVLYHILNKDEYYKIYSKALVNDEFFTVPATINKGYPKDMPLPKSH
ncbi:hypothetical protein [Siphonobacter sp. SORGH_AS_0500]|uniref:hypothetical protein n=1 Tax=Siphonobacter sp. SORGH_AS_0500 TaxID=1864824 RepID=UPI000CB4B8E3|nr:hypothetical protein [Siphonobacter sp. SORGH_AS_0500]MDR6193724.1 hypothetical protein [Siphonobacter sp. SORGH_AS_0500]PKK37907.1 hypothetical protein BWI96_02095 [Siphonobacter sp. SORGH_AS_0500]